MTPSELSMAEQIAFNVEMHIEILKRHKSAGIRQIFFEMFKLSWKKKKLKCSGLYLGL